MHMLRLTLHLAYLAIDLYDLAHDSKWLRLGYRLSVAGNAWTAVQDDKVYPIGQTRRGAEPGGGVGLR